MKMYVFPRDDSAVSLDFEDEQPWLSPAIDATLVRICTFLLAWSAGAAAAVILAVAI